MNVKKVRPECPMGIFTAQDAIKSGISRISFYRLVHNEQIIQLERGLYQNIRSDIDPAELDFIIACKHFGPKASIGGLSALFYYGLSEQIPAKIWVLVPPEVRRSTPRYRVIRTQIDPHIGVIDHPYYRIANLNRSIVESLRFESKIGLKTAINAAREAIRSEKTTDSAILRMAKEMSLENFVLRHWEAIIVD